MLEVKILKNGESISKMIVESQEELDSVMAYHQSRNTFGQDFEISVEDISAKIAQEQINIEALAFLASTDFKVLRHIRQKALGQELSLSEEEYLSLEHQRSDAAARILR